MRLPTISSLLCLAGLVSLPVNAYEGDSNVKSIPVGAWCSLFTIKTEVLTITPIAPNPQPFSSMNDPPPSAALIFDGEQTPSNQFLEERIVDSCDSHTSIPISKAAGSTSEGIL